MSTGPAVVLTNDDGIDSPGLRALYDGLTSVADVTVVAPEEDQSEVGRACSSDVRIEAHELGYVVDGTPSDCVIAAVGSLCEDVDLVVSGCNTGANMGMYVLGRSGTVSAAVEATFFDVPAIATSLYLPTDQFGEETTTDQYATAVGATTHLLEDGLESGVFAHADYLNVNAPPTGSDGVEMAVTRPSKTYEMTATRDGETVTLTDQIWDQIERETVSEPPGTDRRAVLDGRVSVSPLTAPHSSEPHDALDEIAATFG